MTTEIDISPDQLSIVQAILHKNLPKGTRSWAFGSRVTWTAKAFSDLDLAVEHAAALPSKIMLNLEEDFEESELPWRVDLIDLNAVSPEFRAIVKAQRVPADWQSTTLGDVIVNHDTRRVPVKESERRQGPYPYYGASGVVDHVDQFIFDGEYLLIAEDGENLKTRKTPVAFIAKGKFWVNNHAHIVEGNERARTRFLSYALLAAEIEPFLSGAVMPKLTQGNLNRIPISLPPIPEQEAIIGILGALDDKIELNRRMNETLEGMAQAFFKDWFVDFGPVRRKLAGVTDPAAIMGGLAPARAPELAALFPDGFGDDGLPEGWRVSTLANIATVNDESWKVSNHPVRVEYVDLSNTKWGVIESTVILDWADAPSRARRIARPLDTIIGTVRPGNGSYAYVSRTGYTVSTGFAVLRPSKPEYADALYVASTSEENIQRLANLADSHGGAYPAVNPDVVLATDFVFSDHKVIAEFSAFARPIREKIEQAKEENRTLAETRDYLLPKLMSGQVRVRDAEKMVEDAA